MTLSSLWMSAQTIVADSTHKEKIAEKLTALSHMSGEEVISMIIRGALDISARILIALVILAIGRWIIRYLKNIMGLWIIQQIRHELDDKYDFATLASLARLNRTDELISVNDEKFLAPESMIDACIASE